MMQQLALQIADTKPGSKTMIRSIINSIGSVKLHSLLRSPSTLLFFGASISALILYKVPNNYSSITIMFPNRTVLLIYDTVTYIPKHSFTNTIFPIFE